MIIGITGGIGSGKSEVTKYLRSLGETVICADETSRQVVRPGEPGALAIEKTFGSEFFEEDGTLNRSRLATHVFADSSLTLKLNDILHPIIIGRINELASQCKGRVFIDAALLIQAGMQENIDYLWLIAADIDVRIQRVLLRDNTDKQSILQRISNQLSDSEMSRYADEIIYNNGSLSQFYAIIDNLLIKSKYREEPYE